MKLNSLSRTTGKGKAQTVSYIAPEPTVITTSIPSRLNTERILYAVAGGILFVLMFLGFQQFYLYGKAFPDHPIFPPLKGVIIAHGLSMTSWMVLFVVQTLLVVTNRFRTHMLLGLFGIAVAISVVIFSSWTAIATTRLEPELIRQGLTRKQFMIVPLSDMLKFGAFVTIALWNRGRPEIHRPMMLLATLTMISAATGRIPAINNLYVSTIWGQWFGAFFPKLVIGLTFLFIKTLLTQRFDRWLAGGLTVLAILSLLIWQIAPTVAWERVANLLIN
jgi:hypothetical protein